MEPIHFPGLGTAFLVNDARCFEVVRGKKKNMRPPLPRRCIIKLNRLCKNTSAYNVTACPSHSCSSLITHLLSVIKVCFDICRHTVWNTCLETFKLLLSFVIKWGEEKKKSSTPKQQLKIYRGFWIPTSETANRTAFYGCSAQLKRSSEKSC